MTLKAKLGLTPSYINQALNSYGGSWGQITP